jgi:hypothetical protein
MPWHRRFRRAAPLLIVMGAAAWGAGAIGLAALDADLAVAARPPRAAPPAADCDQRAPSRPEGL